MMDAKKIAEDAAKEIFDVSEADGRVIHKGTVVKIIEKLITAAIPRPTWGSVYGTGILLPYAEPTPNQEEWR